MCDADWPEADSLFELKAEGKGPVAPGNGAPCDSLQRLRASVGLQHLRPPKLSRRPPRRKHCIHPDNEAIPSPSLLCPATPRLRRTAPRSPAHPLSLYLSAINI